MKTKNRRYEIKTLLCLNLTVRSSKLARKNFNLILKKMEKEFPHINFTLEEIKVKRMLF